MVTPEERDELLNDILPESSSFRPIHARFAALLTHRDACELLHLGWLKDGDVFHFTQKQLTLRCALPAKPGIESSPDIVEQPRFRVFLGNPPIQFGEVLEQVR